MNLKKNNQNTKLIQFAALLSSMLQVPAESLIIFASVC